jgi:hypothetical protein
MQRKAQCDIGETDRSKRRQGKLAQPSPEMRHVLAEDHEVGRIGDWQHEACGIGNEGADEEIG